MSGLGAVGRLNRATAAAVSRMPTWAYRSIVSVMVECRANSFASFGATPARTSSVMKVCRRAWKSATRPSESR